ncbi:MAG: class II aldolase/adducin family protein [Cyanobacteriota bacterium]
MRPLPNLIPPLVAHLHDHSPLTAELPPLQEQELEVGEALCEVMASIHRRGWCEGTGGNFSAVLARSPLALLMAPSGVDKGAVTPEHLIVVDGEGRMIRGQGQPSAETRLHLAIIETTGAGAVLHTHSQAATLLSRLRYPLDEPQRTRPDEIGDGLKNGDWLRGHLRLEGLEMLKGLEGIRTHTSYIAIPILANSQEMELLSNAAQPFLPSAPHGLLIAGHGLYAWGASLTQACRHLEILEFLLEQYWRQLLLEAALNQAHPSAFS